VKTAPSKNILSRPRPVCALTILEMLVSTALLAFIVLGLTAMFVQTQKAFKTGIKQTSVTDAGRTIIDMMAADLSQLSDPHFPYLYYPPTNLPGYSPALNWALVADLSFVQVLTTNIISGNYESRVNQSEDIFALVQTNAAWLGIGYTVSNWFTNNDGSSIPGVGTLYRYVASTNAPLFTNNQLYQNFNSQIALGTFTNTLFHRIADGVVHLKIYAFNADGNEMYWENQYNSGSNLAYSSYQYPIIELNLTNLSAYVTNYLPHSIDIELGILEPEAFEHARALFTSGATIAASNYLRSNALGQVQIFRQHILIPAAP
jgi:hypothetical protein